MVMITIMAIKKRRKKKKEKQQIIAKVDTYRVPHGQVIPDFTRHDQAGEEDGSPVVVANAQFTAGLFHQPLAINQRHDDTVTF